MKTKTSKVKMNKTNEIIKMTNKITTQNNPKIRPAIFLTNLFEPSIIFLKMTINANLAQSHFLNYFRPVLGDFLRDWTNPG